MKIEVGGVYAISKHIFVCGDLLDDRYFSALQSFMPRSIDLIYSDPPWNAGNHKYWRTHAKVKTSEIHTYDNFLHKFLKNVRNMAAKHIFVEQSLHGKWKDSFLEMAKSYSLLNFDRHWTCHYGSFVGLGDYEKRCRRPNLLLHFGKSIEGLNPENLHGSQMTHHVFQAIKNAGIPAKTVLDLCIGKGMTARIASKFDFTIYGMEINPRRLQYTISWMEKNNNEQARLISRIVPDE